MKLNINRIFILTRHHFGILNRILEFSRPDRSFKSVTSKLIKAALFEKKPLFNPLVYSNNKYVIFWKTRNKMSIESYFIYKKVLKPDYIKYPYGINL